MKKRIILALLIVALAAGGAFAQVSMSAGIGGTLTADFTRVIWGSDGKDYLDTYGYSKKHWGENHIGGGFFGYFDATYVMASLGLNIYGIKAADKDEQKAFDDAKVKLSQTEFNIGIYGKYPIELSGFTLFPLVGADIKLVLAQTVKVDGEKQENDDPYYTDDDGKDHSLTSTLSTVWIKAGVGADIPLTETIYLRPIFLYGIGFLDKEQKDDQKYYNDGRDFGKFINHGLDLKIALGFKL